MDRTDSLGTGTQDTGVHVFARVCAIFMTQQYQGKDAECVSLSYQARTHSKMGVNLIGDGWTNPRFGPSLRRDTFIPESTCDPQQKKRPGNHRRPLEKGGKRP